MSERRSARRSLRAVPERDDTIPAALLAGPCVEVWVSADEERPETSLFGEPTWRERLAVHRFQDARRAWAEDHGMTDHQMYRLMPDRAPYSKHERKVNHG